MPNANIMFLLTSQPRAFMISSDRFEQIVKEFRKWALSFENEFCVSHSCIEGNEEFYVGEEG